jgi:hypothetical protein
VLDLLLNGRSRLFLDGRPDVLAAWSWRRLLRRYTGPLVRIRRSSDNAEADFGAGSALVSWPSVASFVGSGSGATAKWYDQSGHGFDASQATASAQPAVALLGNGLPGCTFDGVNDLLLSAHFGDTVQPITQHVVYRRLTTAAGDSVPHVLTDCLASQLRMAFYMRNAAPVSENSIYAATGPGPLVGDVAISQPVATRGAVGLLFNGAASIIEVDGAGKASFGPGVDIGSGYIGPSPNFDGVSIGGCGNGSFYDNAELQELVLFAGGGAHGQAQMQADNQAMAAFWRC